jgi:membrane-associated phospholipid phosphatase
MMVTLSVIGGVLLSNLLKHEFERSRSDLGSPWCGGYTQGFPSGHAMMSAVVYLTPFRRTTLSLAAARLNRSAKPKKLARGVRRSLAVE